MSTAIVTAAPTPGPLHPERMTREVFVDAQCGHPGCTKHGLETKTELTSIAVWSRSAEGGLGKWVADFHAEHLGISREECEANTALFLAAPQLVEALRAIVAAPAGMSVDWYAGQARAALTAVGVTP